ncbi:sigma-70 family RNA polymerase sigma factor [Spongiactinospora sp. TRM90649]|uniref:sigma-70 family RNA polymerase sigma factor n=1 Tax=Spongiactinospora sp. TRM90649 TaxID=3031114 RepID=UPI0023F67C58|nr:sigma-70 family RNA polymerase sigma factor [Spongiactinospora sp. TRM90649]MDF5754511.1 sigma-70 family RNA polymerase sigma factor [Spongiactinospora sp. TRM90649]
MNVRIGGDDQTTREVGETALEECRIELTGYCYRMLGSAFEAEDAVQETFARAWRNRDRYDPARGPLRPWLFRIATNICLDLLRGAGRRARPVDLGPAARPGPELGAPLPESAWVQPMPDHRVLPPAADPAEVAVARETVRLAFVAALQALPPRQRAVLILRDVLCWRAAEVAGLLGGTVASVNSALQRARATLAERGPSGTAPAATSEAVERDLVDRYVDAFQRYDVQALVALLHEDVTMSMPPFDWWLRGLAHVRTALLNSDGTCLNSRLVPMRMNGAAGFGHYLPDRETGRPTPFAIVVIEVAGDRIVSTTSFIDGAPLFPLFGLPPELEPMS